MQKNEVFLLLFFVNSSPDITFRIAFVVEKRLYVLAVVTVRYLPSLT